ncbi:MAG: HlyD family efflux transporter periplasmic adaptor subunit [Pseudomonadota bacterium]
MSEDQDKRDSSIAGGFSSVRADATGTARDRVVEAQDQSVAVLHHSLWTQFLNAKSGEGFVRAWLGLQCRNIPGTNAALVVLGEPEVGPFSPVATWPNDGDVTPDLMKAANEAMDKRQSVVIAAEGARFNTLALPLDVDGKIFGTVALTLEAGRAPPTDALHQLRWGVGWLEALLRREQSAHDSALHDRTVRALDFVAIVLEQRKFARAGSALVTELASRLGFEQVALGFVRRKRIRITALSHASGFGNRMNLVRDIGLAMDEALDQQDIILHPVPEVWDYRVTRMHADLARAHDFGSVLTVPLQVDGDMIGALTMERPADNPLDQETVELVDVIASLVAPILHQQRKNDRWLISKVFDSLGQMLVALLGPKYFWRKLATLAMIAAVYFGATVTSTFTISAPSRVEGSIQRTIVAPFSSYIQTESVRAGAEVEAGETLATLNDRDLRLERLRWTTARNQREIEFDRALATGERAEANIIRSQIQQADAQLALLDEQLERTLIRAPFDGVLVSGDLSQLVGTAVDRGQELFKIAPLNSFRVVLDIDETDVSFMNTGMSGQLRLSTSPDTPLFFTVEQVTPVSIQRDGRNFFEVEATLDTAPDWVRPNMEGVARVGIDERLVVSIWTRRLVNWVKMVAWRYGL